MAKHQPRKNPSLGYVPTGNKLPVIASEPISYNHLKASWRLRSVQTVDPYGWHELELQELLELRTKLSSFESMTWNEIFVEGKKRNHDIPVAKLKCDNARRWMLRNMPDQPTLWTLRLSGAERVWGVFSGGSYQIVFWDPEHKIYPTEK
jgi:hypothetical protein